MNKAEFIHSKIDNLCKTLIRHHGADKEKVELLKEQLDVTRMHEHSKRLSTDESIGQVCLLAQALVGSDHESVHVIEQYVRCFLDVMKKSSC